MTKKVGGLGGGGGQAPLAPPFPGSYGPAIPLIVY